MIDPQSSAQTREARTAIRRQRIERDDLSRTAVQKLAVLLGVDPPVGRPF